MSSPESHLSHVIRIIRYGYDQQQFKSKEWSIPNRSPLEVTARPRNIICTSLPCRRRRHALLFSLTFVLPQTALFSTTSFSCILFKLPMTPPSCNTREGDAERESPIGRPFDEWLLGFGLRRHRLGTDRVRLGACKWNKTKQPDGSACAGRLTPFIVLQVGWSSSPSSINRTRRRGKRGILKFRVEWKLEVSEGNTLGIKLIFTQDTSHSPN